MVNKLGRNYLNLCFTKIKKPLSTQSSPISPHAADHHRQTRPFSSAAATFLTNYNSLYECTTTFDSNSTSKPLYAAANDGDPDAYFPATAVDFITAFTSHRFFFSSPGRSNSIVESTTAPVSTTSLSSSDDSGGDMLFNNSFAIPTYSPDPYADFRRSMQEMVEAREEMEGTKSSWEFLHELLLCYLALNPKSTHKHIFSAFADLACVMKSSLQPLPPPESVEEDGSGVGKPSQPAAVVRSPANKMIDIDELFNMGLRKN